MDQVLAVPGKGLEGDRYFTRRGTYSATAGSGREVTFIESEAIDAIATEDGIEIDYGASRRNVVTSGVALNHLVGKVFKVGDVEIRGVRLCEPCNHLESLTKKGIRAALVHRGGLRAEILSEGVLKVGDPITAE